MKRCNNLYLVFGDNSVDKNIEVGFCGGGVGGDIRDEDGK